MNLVLTGNAEVNVVVEVAFASHPVRAGSCIIGFGSGISAVTVHVVNGAYFSSAQFQLTIMSRL